MGLLKRVRSNYYVRGADTRRIPDLLKRALSRRVPTFPRTIQIQTLTGCNGACTFCPHNDSYDKVPKGRMSEGLFRRIVAEIAHHGVTRRVSPYLMNEPFIDTTLVDKARHVRDTARSCKVVVTTNGGALSPAVVDDIMRDNPFHALYISMQGIEKHTYEEQMGGALRFEDTKANVEYLIDQRNRRYPDLVITVTMVKTNAIDADAAVAYWRSRGVAAKYTVLENRGGNTAAFGRLNPGEKRLFLDCTRLFKNAYILHNGDMVLCCTDYYKKMVLGNVAETSVAEVWNSPRTTAIRRAFVRGDLRGNPLCAECEVSEVR